MKKLLKVAHEKSIENKKAIKESKIVGCFHCLRIFNPEEVVEYVDNDKTALCPYCGIDSVLPNNQGYPISISFLKKMNDYWFSFTPSKGD